MKSAFLHHLPTKAAALALAILTYSYLFNRANTSAEKELRVTLDGDRTSGQLFVITAGPHGIVYFDGAAPGSLSVQIQGVEAEVERFGGGAVFARADLERFLPNDGQPPTRVPLTPEDIVFRSKPAGVSIVYPKSLPVVFVSRKEYWDVTLSIAHNEIDLTPGFQVVSSTVDPARIRVSGPSEARRRLNLLEIPPSILFRRPQQASVEQKIPNYHIATLIKEKEANVEIDGKPTVTARIEIRPELKIRSIELPIGFTVTTTVDQESGNAISIFSSGLKITVDQGDGTPLTKNDLLSVQLTGPDSLLDKIDKNRNLHRILFDLTEILNQSEPITVGKIGGSIFGLPEGVSHDSIVVNLNYEQ